jgi:hypothetical protein
MKEIIVAFDIDGTLISNTQGFSFEHLNIDVYNLLVLFSKMKNTKIVCWSGGGKDYAEQIAVKYGFSNLIHEFSGKHEYDETISGKVDIAIDDQHEFSMADKNLIVRMK